MLKVEYIYTDYDELIKHFAKSFNSKIKDGKLTLSKDIGEGYMRFVKLPNGLQAIISDYTVYEDVLLQRKKIKDDFFTLRFDEIFLTEDSSAEAASNNQNNAKSAVFLMSTKFDWLFFTPKNTRIKGINIIFSREWLDNFLGIESVGDILKKYLSLKTTSFNYENLDAEYKRIMAEAMNSNEDQIFESLIIQNRITLLMERFFTRIYKKMSDSSFEMKVSTDDLQRLMDVESELLKDFSSVPPGIPKLARMAAMSPSKLKTTFRDIYGLPIYQYFQKHRMNKAKAMLLSQKYTVREVGMEVGYSNLSNFAKAFKKSFDQLPSDILGSR